MSNSTEIRKSNPVEPTLVKKGELMAFIYWVKVEDALKGGDDLNVEDVVGVAGKIRVQGKSLVAGSLSADQFKEVVKVSKTALAQLLVDSSNRPFTVVFEKQDKTDRTLRGRLISHEALLGRSMVEDLDLPLDTQGGRVRLVDHRTLKNLIVDGVKYEVK